MTFVFKWHSNWHSNVKKEMSPDKENISKSLASQRSNQVRIIPQRLRL